MIRLYVVIAEYGRKGTELTAAKWRSSGAIASNFIGSSLRCSSNSAYSYSRFSDVGPINSRPNDS